MSRPIDDWFYEIRLEQELDIRETSQRSAMREQVSFGINFTTSTYLRHKTRLVEFNHMIVKVNRLLQNVRLIAN